MKEFLSIQGVDYLYYLFSLYGSGSLDPMLGFNRPSLLENVPQYQLIEKTAGTLKAVCSTKVTIEQRWRSGESTRLPPMCPAGSIPRPGVICGLNLLFLYSAPKGFSPGTPVFPLLKKQHLTWFALIVNFNLQCPQLSAPALERLDT